MTTTHTRIAVAVAAILLATPVNGLRAAANAGPAPGPPKPGSPVTGTFTDMRYRDGSTGPDIRWDGMEVRIVGVGRKYQATVQFTQDDPAPVVLASVEFEDSNSVTIVWKKADFVLGGYLRGKIGTNGLVGEVVYDNGFRYHVMLPKHKSIWD
jgi:hypothetical protein